MTDESVLYYNTNMYKLSGTLFVCVCVCVRVCAVRDDEQQKFQPKLN